MDPRAQALLACLPRLRRYARALVGDAAQADDLVQDTLERAWTRLHQWRGEGELRAWLFGIMHNVRVDQLRRAPAAVVPLEEAPPEPAEGGDPARWLEWQDLEAAVARLPDEQREVLLLVCVEELRYEEVAQALGVPVGTVMSRLARAREKLRAWRNGARNEPRAGTSLRVVK